MRLLQTLGSAGPEGRADLPMGNKPDSAETLEVAKQVQTYHQF